MPFPVPAGLLVAFALAAAERPRPRSRFPARAPIRPCEIEGQVVGRRGAPVAEAQLVLFKVEAGRGDAVVESTDTDHAGRFRIPPVPPGAYLLDVRADGFDTLRYAFRLSAPVGDLVLRLEPTAENPTRMTFVYAPTALPGAGGTSTSTLTAKEIQALPGGTTRSLNDVIATQPGIVRDDYGAVHVRGSFGGLALRIDDVPLPRSVQDRLQQLLGSQIVERAEVIVGGLPAEFESAAGVVDLQTRRPGPKPDGQLLLAYGTYDTVEGQAFGAGRFGPVSVVAAGSLGTTARGLDPPAASPILHDRLRGGRAFLSADDRLTGSDHLRLLVAYAESHYQIPIDPTLLPLSAAPPGAVRAGDPYGNAPPDFVPYDANPTENERDLFAALSYFHDFTPRARLQIAPFVRYERSRLACDPAGALGATADPGQSCSDVLHRVIQGGAAVNQTVGIGRHDLKAGLLFDASHGTVGYAQYFRDDASPDGGADPAQTIAGEDQVDVLLGAVYVQDRIALGDWSLFPGLRLDLQRASFDGVDTTLLGPSFRLGASYALTPRLLAHAFIGYLWRPPAYDAPTAARVLGVVPAGAAVPADSEGRAGRLRRSRAGRAALAGAAAGAHPLGAVFAPHHRRQRGGRHGAHRRLQLRPWTGGRPRAERRLGALAAAARVRQRDRHALRGERHRLGALSVHADAAGVHRLPGDRQRADGERQPGPRSGRPGRRHAPLRAAHLRQRPAHRADQQCHAARQHHRRRDAATSVRHAAAAGGGHRRAQPVRRRLRLPDLHRQPGRERVRLAARRGCAPHDSVGRMIPMRRSLVRLLLVTVAVTAAGCGFGRADDTGVPIPGRYWGWVCPTGGAPDGDAGCPSADAGASDAASDAGSPGDGAANR